VGNFSFLLWAISFWFRHWKNFKNRPTFAKVTVKIEVAQFFWLTVYIFNHYLKFHQIIHDMSASSKHQQVFPNGISWAPGVYIACFKLTLTLARQIWRHNYVIGRSEYVISTLLESTVPWVYSLQFLFKSTNHSRRYERKCEWMFFFWTQCTSDTLCRIT